MEGSRKASQVSWITLKQNETSGMLQQNNNNVETKRPEASISPSRTPSELFIHI